MALPAGMGLSAAAAAAGVAYHRSLSPDLESDPSLRVAPSFSPAPSLPPPPSSEPLVPRDQHVTSAPPARPPPSAAATINLIRQGGAGALPRGPRDLQEILLSKRGRDTSTASVMLSDEVIACSSSSLVPCSGRKSTVGVVRITFGGRAIVG
ncbi:unnamed protein product [Choristocarpus tenellus]